MSPAISSVTQAVAASVREAYPFAERVPFSRSASPEPPHPAAKAASPAVSAAAVSILINFFIFFPFEIIIGYIIHSYSGIVKTYA